MPLFSGMITYWASSLETKRKIYEAVFIFSFVCPSHASRFGTKEVDRG
jgi:hypothetical protein